MGIDEVERLSAEAHRLATDGSWEEAGRHYAAAGARSVAIQALGPARRAFEAAGEAFRRADVPREAARCARVALTLPSPSRDVTAALRVRLAAVLGELGNGAGALSLCRRAAREASELNTRELVLDTTIGLQQGYGRKRQWRRRVRQLGRVAGAFRAGQLARMDGELDAARQWFATVAQVFDGVRGGEAGAAAAACEQAELDALEGDAGPAVEAYTRAARLHREAGRMSLAWRCEAGRVRASVDAGLDVLPGVLDEGMALAEARAMCLLRIDLRIARGMARSGRDRLQAATDLDAAVAEARQLGLRLREGRALWQRAARLEGPEAATDLARALELLDDHVPLRTRVREMAGHGGSR
ncbi:MAG: tetratricopeptide (TPR) repeat protein [Myxococcota bacterium]